ncbi:branched-chain amino acid transporter permease [Helicobacter cappadocius]|uniref:AzlD domain-containing protein n=1 Tax=Helicobacter cappadocius TaxID=3063998 RepID=A0AA90PYR8_9HELI|nr:MULTISPECIES: AzlD domain-containing protein [unclassified Helicobacter]MDO7252982.1 AzlD domain-containing protein [Helicobacter sp. faydin-H75]MDP2539028.1 AzlD domain-containing protein [Helicobacter sp. faydin-H76]
MFDSIVVVLVIVVVTFLSRALPFMIFNSKRNAPNFLCYLGKVLPNAIVGMLIVYCLKDIDINISPFGSNEILALLCVVVLQIVLKISVVSIIAGTILYMYLIQSNILNSFFNF